MKRSRSHAAARKAKSSAVDHRLSAVAPTKWAQIRLFAMDVDGVLTDGTVVISSDGSEAKAFSILDGYGLRRLEKAGVAVAWISGRPSAATTRRAEELDIPHLVQGRIDKITALQELAGKLRLQASEIAYMGDDTIDGPAIAWAGIGIAPAEAMPTALTSADYVTRRPAGRGAVREVCEHILAAQSAAGAAAGRTGSAQRIRGSKAQAARSTRPANR